MSSKSFCVSTLSDWTWHPTSWRRFLLTHCSCGSQCTPRWRDPPSRRWCWVLVGTLCTVTASWSGFAGWPERMTWRRVRHQKIWLGNTSGPSERYSPHPRRKNWSSSKRCSFSPTVQNLSTTMWTFWCQIYACLQAHHCYVQRPRTRKALMTGWARYFVCLQHCNVKLKQVTKFHIFFLFVQKSRTQGFVQKHIISAVSTKRKSKNYPPKKMERKKGPKALLRPTSPHKLTQMTCDTELNK